ncbi:MAG: hypothetical protein U0797_19270 [Gemmataceae bacterium]
MLDIQAEAHDAGQHYQDLYEAVVDLKRRHDLHPCAVRPRDGLSPCATRSASRCRTRSSASAGCLDETPQAAGALWNLAQLEVVVGDLDASLADFQEVARIVSDPISIAERTTTSTARPWLQRLGHRPGCPEAGRRPRPPRRSSRSRSHASSRCASSAGRPGSVVPAAAPRFPPRGRRQVAADSLDRDAASLFRDAAAAATSTTPRAGRRARHRLRR